MKLQMARDLGVGALILGIAVGCAPAVHTAQWYADHPAEMKARLDECQRLGIARGDQDCLNAAGGEAIAASHGKPVDPF